MQEWVYWGGVGERPTSRSAGARLGREETLMLPIGRMWRRTLTPSHRSGTMPGASSAFMDSKQRLIKMLRYVAYFADIM